MQRERLRGSQLEVVAEGVLGVGPDEMELVVLAALQRPAVQRDVEIALGGRRERRGALQPLREARLAARRIAEREVSDEDLSRAQRRLVRARRAGLEPAPELVAQGAFTEQSGYQAGRELMLFVLRDEDGAPTAQSAATLVERDGTTHALGRADFTLDSGATWTSPRSHADYPARWTIAIPGAGLRLELAPLVPDCELKSDATGVSYWEGPVEVKSADGRVTGRGYAELTGYAGSMAGRF